MKLSGAVLLATSVLTAVAWPQSPTLDIHAHDSTAAIRAFSEASRVGVSLNALDREAVETVARNVDPTTERVVGYAALTAGVIAITILAIGFYKLVKLLGG